MQYLFTCSNCGQQFTFSQYHMIGAPLARRCHCGGVIRRCIGEIHYSKPMREHYNPSSNSYVSSYKSWKEDMKRRGEEMSVRTGMEHRYVEVDPLDPKSVGVTSEGLESTARTKSIDLDPLFKKS